MFKHEYIKYDVICGNFSYCIYCLNLCCSELKRRMKQEQKAKEKAEKEKTEQDSKSTKKKDTTSVIKEDEISPNVS